MKYIVDAKTMQAIDRYSMNEVGIPSLVLMEKAAMKMALFIKEKIEKTDRILAVCGTGNNGGDGLACARMLKEDGYLIDILFFGQEERATEQVKIQLNIVRNLGMSVYNSVKMSEYNIIIDGIFGVGLKRPIEGLYKELIQRINDSGAKIFAVDVPSGVDCTTGKILNIAIRANYTVTFGYQKFGLILNPGCDYAGEVVVADIGFPKQAIQKITPSGFYYEKSDMHRLPVRKSHSNKGSYGKVLVIAGSKEVSGAAYFSAKAAYRMGAGLVKIFTEESNRMILNSLLPEALMTTYREGHLDTSKLQEDIEWSTVVVLGPGIGRSETAAQLLRYCVENVKITLILDADAINLLADGEKYVIKDKMIKNTILRLPSNVILTPHLKEMSRLIKESVDTVASNVLEISKSYRGDYVLVLKDSRTIVVDREHLYVNVSGNHGMATGGSGDVLTGIIAGLVAQGMDNYGAASLGVYLHGLAGDFASEEKNCYSVMAGDIVEALSNIL